MNGRMKSLEHRTTDCCRSQRELLAILEDDEGKAGAINFYGPAYGLLRVPPPAMVLAGILEAFSILRVRRPRGYLVVSIV